MRARKWGAVFVCMVLLLALALPAMAQPANGASSWWGWLAEGWQSVVRVLAGETVPAEEPEPESEPEATVCLPLVSCPEVDDDTLPGLDPDGLLTGASPS